MDADIYPSVSSPIESPMTKFPVLNISTTIDSNAQEEPNCFHPTPEYVSAEVEDVFNLLDDDLSSMSSDENLQHQVNLVKYLRRAKERSVSEKRHLDP